MKVQKNTSSGIFVVVAVAGTLVTAISFAAPAAHATALCSPEKDTRGCPNPQEKRSSDECDTNAARACVTTPPCTRTVC
jgi:hypothetical protein